MAKNKKSFWKTYFEVAKSIGEWMWKYFSIWHEEIIELKPSNTEPSSGKKDEPKLKKDFDYFVYFDLKPYSWLTRPN